MEGDQGINHAKKHRSNIPNRIIKDGIEINDTKGIANAFNDYFASIWGKLADAIPLISESPKSFLKASQQNCFFLYPVTTTEIQNEIKSSIRPKHVVLIIVFPLIYCN
jgi:hypothetical protein